MSQEVNWRQGNRYFSHRPCKGCTFGGFDTVFSTQTEIESVQSPGLFIGLMLSGAAASISVDGVGELQIPKGRPVLINFAERTRCTNRYRTGEFCAGAGIHVNFDALPKRLDSPLNDVMPFLQQRFALQTDLEVLPVLPSMTMLANQALQIPDGALFRDLELEGIFLNILMMICRELGDHHVVEGTLSHKERRRVNLVTEHLRRNLEKTPSLTELSHLAGVNQDTLSNNFKAVHGQTIFAYYRDLRLDVAQSILRCNTDTVTQVSMRVGYASPAAFATAYRRRFGYSPSEETAKT